MEIFFEVIKRLFILSFAVVAVTMWIMVFASDNRDNNDNGGNDNNDDNDNDGRDDHGKT